MAYFVLHYSWWAGNNSTNFWQKNVQKFGIRRRLRRRLPLLTASL
jgi:hypothetical protein